jgi:hypothetical protein
MLYLAKTSVSSALFYKYYTSVSTWMTNILWYYHVLVLPSSFCINILPWFIATLLDNVRACDFEAFVNVLYFSTVILLTLCTATWHGWHTVDRQSNLSQYGQYKLTCNINTYTALVNRLRWAPYLYSHSLRRYQTFLLYLATQTNEGLLLAANVCQPNGWCRLIRTPNDPASKSNRAQCSHQPFHRWTT